MISWTTHRREVKLKAKRALFGNMVKGIWMGFFSFLLASLALAFFPINIPNELPDNASTYTLLRSLFPEQLTPSFWGLVAITLILYTLLTAPFSVGMSRFFLQASRGEKPKFRIVFTPFMNFREMLGSCLLKIIIAVWTVLWGILLFAAPILLFYFSNILGPMSLILGLPLYLGAIPCMLIAVASFSLASFIYAEDSSQGAWRSVLTAFSRARGARIELAVFQLSFFFWQFFAMSLYPFGTILLTPYVQTALAGFLDTIDTCKQ